MIKILLVNHAQQHTHTARLICIQGKRKTRGMVNKNHLTFSICRSHLCPCVIFPSLSLLSQCVYHKTFVCWTKCNSTREPWHIQWKSYGTGFAWQMDYLMLQMRQTLSVSHLYWICPKTHVQTAQFFSTRKKKRRKPHTKKEMHLSNEIVRLKSWRKSGNNRGDHQ